MIFRVAFEISYFDCWKDFNTLFDAANYASEIRGTVFNNDKKVCPIERLRIEFIEPEEEKSGPQQCGLMGACVKEMRPYGHKMIIPQE